MNQNTRVGEILEGRYEILKEIGKGGMSIVYLAMDIKVGTQWAVKEIKKSRNNQENQVYIKSFMAEVDLIKELDYPAFPRIVDTIDNGDTLFVVMDYIEGENLRKYVKEKGIQSKDIILDWAKQICRALQYLHSQDPPIIYRDMKPGNIMLKQERDKQAGNLKVIDFGIAKKYKNTQEENDDVVGTDIAETETEKTKAAGTKGYAAPEQMSENGKIDLRADIYAFGATLFCLTTGISPSNEPNCLANTISYYNPEYRGSGMELIIKKCVQPLPEDRYQNCDELLYDLENIEKITAPYIRKLKMKLCIFSVFFGISVFSALVAAGCMWGVKNQKDQLYEQKIGISESTDYDIKIQTYGEAIELLGTDVRAYEKLLQAYEDNGKFGDEESNQFVTINE